MKDEGETEVGDLDGDEGEAEHKEVDFAGPPKRKKLQDA
jgi:hypothetical protein